MHGSNGIKQEAAPTESRTLTARSTSMIITLTLVQKTVKLYITEKTIAITPTDFVEA